MNKSKFLSILAICLIVCQITSAANVYVATNGKDSTCARNEPGKPCLSFGQAYAIAQAGDIIEVGTGTYSSQSLPSASKGTSAIIFRPALGATVILGSLSIHASYVEIQSMTIIGGIDITPAGSGLPSSTNHVTLRNINGKSMFIIAEDVLVQGGDFGGFDACISSNQEDIIQIWQDGSGHASSRVTFDGVKIHDITDHNNICADGQPGAVGRHVDCMQILAGHFITVRNSQFYNCATSDIIARPYIDTLNDIVIENNFFQDVMNPGVALNLGSSGDKYGGTNVVRYNYISSFSAAFSSGSMQVYGNIMQTGACQSPTYSYNIFLPGWSATCGTNSKRGNPTFVGPTPSPSYNNGIVPNYHLAPADTVAIDAGDPSSYPATDIDGETRFSGLAPDAGADEYTSSQQKCSDGTSYGACSLTKPKYCQNGALMDNCQTCGCTTGQACQGDGTCQAQQQTCSQQGGTCCATGQTCTGTTKSAGDCTTCCVGSCQSQQTCIAGDLNCDKKVDIFDLVLVAQNYGKTSGFDTKADVNKDGKVNIFDLVIVAQNYGKSG